MAREAREIKPISRASAERMWETRLESIPSVFARLIYIAHLRHFGGQYEEPDFNSLVSAALGAEIIRDSHASCFSTWLSMDLRSKTEDLKPYLKSLLPIPSANCRPSSMPEDSFSQLFRKLIPDDASPAEIELFLSTVSIVKKLVGHRLGLK